MPKPAWAQRRQALKQFTRQVEELFDKEKFADAIDEVESSTQAANDAQQNPAAYLKRKGVDLPAEIILKEIRHQSPVYIHIKGEIFGNDFEITIQW